MRSPTHPDGVNFSLTLATVLVACVCLFTARREGEIGHRVVNRAEDGRQIILEVMNIHFTMGEQIPAIFLRVFTDGTAECHTYKFTKAQKDVIKTKVLGAEEFADLNAIINDPKLLDVNKRYQEMRRFVVDSWMEWNITLHHSGGAQRIEVVSFSPSSAREQSQPYPEALVNLGCAIVKIRNDVYGGEQAFSDTGCPENRSAH